MHMLGVGNSATGPNEEYSTSQVTSSASEVALQIAPPIGEQMKGSRGNEV